MADNGTLSTPTKFTEREHQLAVIAWQCLKSEPQIDYDQLARVASFKNKASAAACMRPVMKKLMTYAPAGNIAGSVAGTPNSAAGSKRKRAAKSMADDSDDEIEPMEQTPSKRARHIKTQAKGTAKSAPQKMKSPKNIFSDDLLDKSIIKDEVENDGRAFTMEEWVDVDGAEEGVDQGIV